MICPYCGQEITDGVASCPICCAVLDEHGLNEQNVTGQDVAETDTYEQDIVEQDAAEQNVIDADPSLSTDLKNNNWGVPTTTTYINLCEPVNLFKAEADRKAAQQKVAGLASTPKKKQSVLGIVSFCMSLTVVLTIVSLITSSIDMIVMFVTSGKPNAKKHGLGVAAFIISLFFVAILMEWI